MSEPEFPNRIDDVHRNGINDFVSENVPSGDFGQMIEFMFDNWLLVIDRAEMVEGSKQRRLGALKRERDRQDTERQGLDDEIRELEN